MKPLAPQNCLALILSGLLIASSAQAASALTVSQLKNAKVHMPSLGQGRGNQIQLKNGKGKTAAVPFVEMTTVAIGTTGGTPTAVSHVTWNTGGSGYWDVLLLFKESKGKLNQVGNYTTYIGSTDKLEIKQNRIFIHLKDQESADALTKEFQAKKEANGWISLSPSEFTK